MGKIVSGLFGLLVLCTSFYAHARLTSARDLACDLESGSRVTLKSNNSLWSVWESEKFNVELILENESGSEEILKTIWTNEKAAHTRGNDQGERQYIFTSERGEEHFVALEFHAPFGVAEGIKLFRVLSTSLQFEHKQDSLSGKCTVVYHAPSNI